jgi:hypothetical protein
MMAHPSQLNKDLTPALDEYKSEPEIKQKTYRYKDNKIALKSV